MVLVCAIPSWRSCAIGVLVGQVAPERRGFRRRRVRTERVGRCERTRDDQVGRVEHGALVSQAAAASGVHGAGGCVVVRRRPDHRQRLREPEGAVARAARSEIDVVAGRAGHVAHAHLDETRAAIGLDRAAHRGCALTKVRQSIERRGSCRRDDDRPGLVGQSVWPGHRGHLRRA